jgi:hypothetical protein
MRGVIEKSDIQKIQQKNNRDSGNYNLNTDDTSTCYQNCGEFKNTITRHTFIKLLDVLPSHGQGRYVCLVAFRLTRFYFTELGTSMFV